MVYPSDAKPGSSSLQNAQPKIDCVALPREDEAADPVASPSNAKPVSSLLKEEAQQNDSALTQKVQEIIEDLVRENL